MALQDYNYEFFAVSFPVDGVAHVEIDRAGKMNAFVEVYGSLFLFGEIMTRPCRDEKTYRFMRVGWEGCVRSHG